jgi:hypothetical protein
MKDHPHRKGTNEFLYQGKSSPTPPISEGREVLIICREICFVLLRSDDIQCLRNKHAL